MKRCMLVAAVAACFATAAQAASEVVVYGVLMPFVENVKTSDATQGAPSDRPSLLPATAYTGVNDSPRTRITVGTTQLGFRGFEDIGADLRLVWQLESGFQIDQNAGPGLGARNSKVGLSSKAWGEVNLGQWDTPYKFISLPINPFRAGYVFDYTNIMGNPGLGVPDTTTQFTRVPGKPDAAFDRRQGNSIQYWTPRWAGFSARFMVSVNEGRTLPSATNVGISPTLYSMAVMYDNGPLSIRYGYEEHRDYFGLSQLSSAGSSAAATAANGGSKDKANKVVVLWRIGNTRLAGAFEELKYHNDDSLAGALTDYKRRAFYGIVEQFFAGGNQSVWASYGKAEDGSCGRAGGLSCSTNSMGADFWALGYIYRFSKRTEGYLAYYKIDNKQSGTYATQPFVVNPVAPGADTTGYGGGLIHYF